MRIVHRFECGVSARPDWVTGTAEVTGLMPVGVSARLRIDSVTFAPGSRTMWHRHPTGQLLAVTSGYGLAQGEGSAGVAVGPGSTVWIEPDDWHWHGAVPREHMTHVAIECAPPLGRQVERRGPVTDEQYSFAAHAQGDARVRNAI